MNSFTPEGWLKDYLKRQRDGLTGHLDVAGYPFDTVGWDKFKDGIDYDCGVASEWWPYEQTGYWVDGMTRCGMLLRDEFLMNKAEKSIRNVLDHPDADGYLGPRNLKKSDGTEISRWAHAVFFRALMAYSALDASVIPAMERHYLSDTSGHYHNREACNLEMLLWLYQKTGNGALLERAEKAYERFNEESAQEDFSVESLESDRVSTTHGVSFHEMAKLGVLMYLSTGKERYLKATVHGYEKIRRDQELPSGVSSSSEFLRGKDPLDSYETCDISDMSWSLGYLLMATGDIQYADMIEKIIFNAAPGSVTEDFKALQYFSCGNQVICDRRSNHNLFYRGDKWMSYRPNPGTECCPGNVNRAMPNFASRLWMERERGVYAAALYGPSQVVLTDRGGRKAVVEEETAYPFEEGIVFTVHGEEKLDMDLIFRIPGWCAGAALRFGDASIAGRPGEWLTVRGPFAEGSKLFLTLPMSPVTRRWGVNGVSVERGPLVYVLPVEERREIDEEEEKASEEFPAYNMYPASGFGYGLTEKALSEGLEFHSRIPQGNEWTPGYCPVWMTVPAVKLPEYQLNRQSEIESQRPDPPVTRAVFRLEGDYTFTPPLIRPEEIITADFSRQERIRLIPYGASCLRVTVFPLLGKKD